MQRKQRHTCIWVMQEEWKSVQSMQACLSKAAAEIFPEGSGPGSQTAAVSDKHSTGCTQTAIMQPQFQKPNIPTETCQSNDWEEQTHTLSFCMHPVQFSWQRWATKVTDTTWDNENRIFSIFSFTLNKHTDTPRMRERDRQTDTGRKRERERVCCTTQGYTHFLWAWEQTNVYLNSTNFCFKKKLSGDCVIKSVSWSRYFTPRISSSHVCWGQS